jgi:hypothetical protein
MGAGAQEKWWVARDFVDRAAPLGMKLDVSWREEDRIYGNNWYRFVANCRGMLGAEAGVSITDVDGSFMEKYEMLMSQRPDMSFDEISTALLKQYENNIPARVMSPRCFEAAVFDTCQILFEGEYNGVLTPWRHYLPLKRDFSNFDEVVRAFRDPAIRKSVTDAAYQDLIASGEYSYRSFVQEFDNDLIESAGWKPPVATSLDRDRQKEFRIRQRRRFQIRLAKLSTIHGATVLLRKAGFVTRRFPVSWRNKVRKWLGMSLRNDS